MFQFFTKQYFLADHLEGLVDIHNHILPGIDDGAKTTTESLALIKDMEAMGITDFICTPHIMDNYYPNTPESIADAETTLKIALAEEGLQHIKIRAAAEHMIDSNFENILKKGNIMPLDGRYLLIEMSYLQPSINFNEAIAAIREKQLFTVFAHPERYQYLSASPKKFAQLKEQGIHFQLNLLSLGGYYGKEVYKLALALLEDGFYDFVGSDVHNMRHIWALSNVRIRKKHRDQLAPIMEFTKETFGYDR